MFTIDSKQLNNLQVVSRFCSSCKLAAIGFSNPLPAAKQLWTSREGLTQSRADGREAQSIDTSKAPYAGQLIASAASFYSVA